MNVLYRFFLDDGSLGYVGVTANPFDRFVTHYRTQSWRDRIARIELERFETLDEARMAERKAVFKEKPIFNRALQAKAADGRKSFNCKLPDSAWLDLQHLYFAHGLKTNDAIIAALSFAARNTKLMTESLTLK